MFQDLLNNLLTPSSDQVKNLAMTLSSAQLCRANEEAKQKDGNLYNTLVIDRSHSVDTFNEVSPV